MHWKCNLKLMRNTSARVVVCAHNVATDELCFCFIFFFSFKCISVAPLHVLFFFYVHALGDVLLRTAPESRCTTCEHVVVLAGENFSAKSSCRLIKIEYLFFTCSAKVIAMYEAVVWTCSWRAVSGPVCTLAILVFSAVATLSLFSLPLYLGNCDGRTRRLMQRAPQVMLDVNPHLILQCIWALNCT